jgi:hypothetical protein
MRFPRFDYATVDSLGVPARAADGGQTPPALGRAGCPPAAASGFQPASFKSASFQSMVSFRWEDFPASVWTDRALPALGYEPPTCWRWATVSLAKAAAFLFAWPKIT